ncbi:protein CREG1 [Camponotus floridanus]|uniref:protein CREG1 n=1 Tax=Camponotus floridanus TaxID=104421 RepID=UPI000DC6CEA1|nr:protein CREG1 [Camponotus floridanus]
MMLQIVSVIAFCVLLSEARIFNVERNRTHHSHHRAHDLPPKAHHRTHHRTHLPPANETALVARYIVNHAEWAAIATVSVQKDTDTYPVADVVSISDGPIENGTGIPYMYITPLDTTTQNLDKDNRATLLVSLAEKSYCKDKHLDPMDPRCAKVTLTGIIVPVKDTAELKTVTQSFFGRHPGLQNLPADHHFYFAKLEILNIDLLDGFGGLKHISVEDYYHPSLNHTVNKLYERAFVSNIVSNIVSNE